MPQNDDLAQFRKDLKASLARNQEAFDGQYKDALDDLYGLSKDEIKAITLSVTSAEDYAKLIAVVKEASRKNIAQGELVNQIKALGSTAVSIARSISTLAALFA